MATQTTSLSALAPIAMTDAILTSSTVAETDYPAWVSGTTYALGDRVIKNHRIYESLKASNIGHDPTLQANQVGSPAWWLDVSATNRWAMFDNSVSTQTSGASPLTVVMKPGPINSLYLGKLLADNLTITIKDAPGGNVVYSYNASLENSMPPDYYEYLFSPFEQQTDFLVSNLAPYYNCEVTVTLTAVSGNCYVGMLAMGDLRPLGTTQYGAKVSPKTYSSITTDKFGNTSIVRRKAATNMTAEAILTLDRANAVVDTIQTTLDTPVVVVGTDLPAYSGLRVFGLLSGEIEYTNYAEVTLSISVQGMI